MGFDRGHKRSHDKSKRLRVLLLGLDGAGKTTIFDRLEPSALVETPIQGEATIGFNLKTITHNETRCLLVDVGGKNTIRPLWRHYISAVDILVFVVDSSDELRIAEARLELHRIMRHPALRAVALLIFANKQDVTAVKADAIRTLLDLDKVAKVCDLRIQPLCAITGQGLADGLSWICQR